MARTLDQIIAELNPSFNPQVQSIEQRAQLIPNQLQADESALNAQKDQAYEDIVSGARRRGLGFSGVPLGEQAKYAATNYAPALANLRNTSQQNAMSLQDAILGIRERQNTLAQQLYSSDLDRDAQERQAELSRRAAAAAAFSPSYGGGAGGGQAKVARYEERKPGSFAFYDADNTPITAYQYAQRTGQNIGDILYFMGQKGDKQAAGIYNTLHQFALDGPDEFNRALNQLRTRQGLTYILGGQ